MLALDIIITILLWIAGIAGFIGVIGIIPFSIAGIIFLAKNSNENDVQTQKSLKKRGIIFLALPWILIAGGLIILLIMLALRSLVPHINSF